MEQLSAVILKINIQPMGEKSSALRKMAGNVLQRIERTDEKLFPAQVTVDYYTILHMLLEAQTLEKGVKFKGESAHKELIKNSQLSSKEKMFLQRLRELRNKIQYEGTTIRPEYVVANKKMILQLITKLKYQDSQRLSRSVQ